MKKYFGNITCPKCGHVKKMEIPQTSCLPFYKCDGCGELIKAEKSCCVFCDYADKACPVSDKKVDEMKNDDVKKAVREGYDKIAEKGFCCSCGCETTGKEDVSRLQ